MFVAHALSIPRSSLMDTLLVLWHLTHLSIECLLNNCIFDCGFFRVQKVRASHEAIAERRDLFVLLIA